MHTIRKNKWNAEDVSSYSAMDWNYWTEIIIAIALKLNVQVSHYSKYI